MLMLAVWALVATAIVLYQNRLRLAHWGGTLRDLIARLRAGSSP
jgi:hypothetical protein